MSDHSAIEWTGGTWNCVLGCDKVSDGCRYCYAILQCWMKQHNPNPKIAAAYAGLVERRPDGSLNWTGRVNCLPERLDLPLRWKEPRRIFVKSLSDLFHEDVPDEFIDQVFAVMAWAEHHTFQVLTKRPERMREYLTHPERLAQIESAMCGVCTTHDGPLCDFGNDDCQLDTSRVIPLRNVWLGVSVEDQRAADERIPLLLQTPAAVRFLSCEPLIGPVDLGKGWRHWCSGCGPTHCSIRHFESAGQCHDPLIDGIDWVIAGGESGPKFRPMDLDWARQLRDVCQAAGVAFHFKQVGGRTHAAGGRDLDGRTWDEFPTARQPVAV